MEQEINYMLTVEWPMIQFILSEDTTIDNEQLKKQALNDLEYLYGLVTSYRNEQFHKVEKPKPMIVTPN